MQRTGIKFFRSVTRAASASSPASAQRGYFIRDICRAFSDPATWGRETSGRCGASAWTRSRSL